MSSEQWTIENIETLREAFNFYDSNNDGQVKIAELEEAIRLTLY
jgi:Ca2+-binding EF-hand superfamily protein